MLSTLKKIIQKIGYELYHWLDSTAVTSIAMYLFANQACKNLDPTISSKDIYNNNCVGYPLFMASFFYFLSLINSHTDFAIAVSKVASEEKGNKANIGKLAFINTNLTSIALVVSAFAISETVFIFNAFEQAPMQFALYASMVLTGGKYLASVPNNTLYAGLSDEIPSMNFQTYLDYVVNFKNTFPTADRSLPRKILDILNSAKTAAAIYFFIEALSVETQSTFLPTDSLTRYLLLLLLNETLHLIRKLTIYPDPVTSSLKTGGTMDAHDRRRFANSSTKLTLFAKKMAPKAACFSMTLPILLKVHPLFDNLSLPLNALASFLFILSVETGVYGLGLLQKKLPALSCSRLFHRAQGYAQVDQEEIPDEYYCPITGDVMKNPYILSLDGRSYEYDAILHHLKKNRDSPFNRKKMKETQKIEDVITLNRNLKEAIERFKEKNPRLSDKRENENKV